MNTARGVVLLVVALFAGLTGYQIGISQNIAAQLPAGQAMAYGYPFWHWGFGFGIFGLIFPLLFFFLLFGLLRAAFWGGRGYGSHWADRRSRLEELHREMHGEKPSSGGPQT